MAQSGVRGVMQAWSLSSCRPQLDWEFQSSSWWVLQPQNPRDEVGSVPEDLLEPPHHPLQPLSHPCGHSCPSLCPWSLPEQPRCPESSSPAAQELSDSWNPNGICVHR